MKPPRTKWCRPSHALGLLVTAGALGAWVLATQPTPAWRGGFAFRGVPTAPPGGLRIVTAGVPRLATMPAGAVDHCVVPAPDVDHRFVVPAPDVGDRCVVAPRVWGMPVRSQTAPGY